MKSGEGTKILCLLFLIVLCVSIVSAASFVDFIKWMFTGKVTGDDCLDSDGYKNYFVKGNVYTENVYFWDGCEDENVVYDYHCDAIPSGGDNLLAAFLPITGHAITGYIPEDEEEPGSVDPPPKTTSNCMLTYNLPCVEGRCGECDNGQTNDCSSDPNLPLCDSNPATESCICHYGTQTCTDYVWGDCITPIECSQGETCTDTGGGTWGCLYSCPTKELICNDGIDNDCDNLVDCKDSDCDGKTCNVGMICQGGNCANPGQDYCTDLDGDLYSKEINPDICGNICGIQNCFGGGDCNDANKFIYPGAEEICYNNLDDDCDGKIDGDDQSCNETCIPNCQDYECGLDPICETEDCGTCPDGKECSEGECITPTECYDNDTDYYCWWEDTINKPAVGCPTSCSANEGKDCDDNDNTINPAEDEICDGVDNNCDGTTDDLEKICGSDQSVYQPPTSQNNMHLISTDFGTEPEYVPIVWDYNDPSSWVYNDTSSTSICSKGIQICDWDNYASSGGWTDCQEEITPETETCGDNLDNDCDGSVNEGCDCTPGQSIACGDGICEIGTQECGSDGKWEECNITNKNDNCECLPGDTGVTCGSSAGECILGLQICSQTGKWICNSPLMPGEEQEICDKLDNDCDGSIDENGVCDVGENDNGTYGEGKWKSDLSGENIESQQEGSKEERTFLDWLFNLFFAIFKVGRTLIGGVISEQGTMPTTSPIHCVDTDGGNSPYVTGTAHGLDRNGKEIGSSDYCYEGKTNNKVDACLGGDCKLSERYCGADHQTIEVENNIECPNGCSNGACLAKSETGEDCLYFDTFKWKWINECNS